MRRTGVSLIGGFFFALMLLSGGSPGGTEPKILRVCADPDNLPFSNDKLEGFENKIAELVTQDLGAQLSYTWWPHQRGLVRRTLNQDQCDVLIGIPKGYDPVLWTTPYYRTAYVIASVKERGLQITSLDDPRLSQLKIGVHVNTPPHDALTQRRGRHFLAQRIADCALHLDDAQSRCGARRALLQVLAGIELSVRIALQLLRCRMSHDRSPNAARTFCRARMRRELTVPIGMDSVSAISL